jgi:hypothetical protein
MEKNNIRMMSGAENKRLCCSASSIFATQQKSRGNLATSAKNHQRRISSIRAHPLQQADRTTFTMNVALQYRGYAALRQAVFENFLHEMQCLMQAGF